MKFLVIPLTAVFLILIGCNQEKTEVQSFSSTSDELVIVTKKEKGLGSFLIQFPRLNLNNENQSSQWGKMYPKYSGIPDSLKNLVISTNPTNWGQFLYQSYKSGIIDREFYHQNAESWKLDTVNLYPKPIKTFFSVALGQNSKDEWVFVLDQNNNLDFSDDKLKRLKTEMRPFLLDNDSILMNTQSFVYESFDGKKVKKDSSWIYLFRDFFGGLNYISCEYRKANFILDSVLFEIELKNRPNFLEYCSRDSELGLKKFGNEFRQKIPNKFLSKIGEYLVLNNTYYKIERLSLTGDSIILIRDRDAEKKGGTRIGMKAIDISAYTINAKRLNLSDYHGKYVLIDFWGTWCNPCLAELPTLKKAYELFTEKNLVIIGIASDTKQKLLEFLSKNSLPWDQIPQYSPDNDSILKEYRINNFPSTFLIDPNGIIISKNLSGEDLIYKLDQILNTKNELMELGLKGKYKFELNGFKYADVVYVRIYSMDNLDDDWTVMMYQIENKWIGSVDLKFGNYTYEFSVDRIRIKDPLNKEYKFSTQGDRQLSILRIKN